MKKSKKLKSTIELYTGLFKEHGYTPAALGCAKGKQFLRYHELTADFDLSGAKILDVGCGFGDFNNYLKHIGVKNYHYVGVDIMDEFIDEAKRRYKGKNITFLNGNFLESEFNETFDYAIASGTFNLKIENVDGYSYISQNIEKMLSLSSIAVAIDFLSDKVDYKYEYNFNSDPLKILEIGYGFSRNLILKNNYFPFEFSLTLFKNEEFKKETTVFDEAKEKFDWLGI